MTLDISVCFLLLLIFHISAVSPVPAASESRSGLDRAEWEQVQTLQQMLNANKDRPSAGIHPRILNVPVDARQEDLDNLGYGQEGLHAEEARSVAGGDSGVWNVLSDEGGEGEEEGDALARRRGSASVRAPAIPPEQISVTSQSPVRLSLSPASRLRGVPGATVHVEFQLTNLGPDRRFFLLAAEKQGIVKDGVNFPPSKMFLTGMSETSTFLAQNETRTVVLTIEVPMDAYMGMLRIITLEAQHRGSTAAGNLNSMLRRFHFVVGEADEVVDTQPPICKVTEDTYEQDCASISLTDCDRRQWRANFRMQDLSSGLRTLSERPLVGDSQDQFYFYDNFVIGSTSPAEFLYSSTCCHRGLSVIATDVQANTATCSAGGHFADKDDVKLGTLGIVGIVIIVVLVVVVVAALVSIVLIRKRRKAELAEMRASPQAR